MSTTTLPAAPATTPAAPNLPPGTLGKEMLWKWLQWFDEEATSAETLHKLDKAARTQLYKAWSPAKQRKQTALFAGSYAVRETANESARAICKRGGLLFIGSAAALEACKAVKEGE